jgi:hypothetical protein
MKRVLLILVAAAAVSMGVDALADLTQDRPDRMLPGTGTEIVLHVQSRDRGGSALLSAQGLWGACQGTVRHRLAEPGVVEVSDGRFRMVTVPALGEHSWRRLQGCLEDTTLDKVKAEVVSKRDVVPSPTP